MGNWNQVGLNQETSAQFMSNASNAAHKAGSMATTLAQQVNRNRKTEFEINKPMRDIKLEKYKHHRDINRRMLENQTYTDIRDKAREEREQKTLAFANAQLENDRIYSDSADYSNLAPNGTVYSEPQYDQEGRVLLDETGQPIVKQYMMRDNAPNKFSTMEEYRQAGGAVDVNKLQAAITENMQATGLTDRATAAGMVKAGIESRYGKPLTLDEQKYQAGLAKDIIDAKMNTTTSAYAGMMGGSPGASKGRGQSRGPSGYYVNADGSRDYSSSGRKTTGDIKNTYDMAGVMDTWNKAFPVSRGVAGTLASSVDWDDTEVNREIGNKALNRYMKIYADSGVPEQNIRMALANQVKDSKWIGGAEIISDLLLDDGVRTPASDELMRRAGSSPIKGSDKNKGIGNNTRNGRNGGRRYVSTGPSLAQQKAERLAHAKMMQQYVATQEKNIGSLSDTYSDILKKGTRRTREEIFANVRSKYKTNAAAKSAAKRTAEAAKKSTKTNIKTNVSTSKKPGNTTNVGKNGVDKNVDINKAKTDAMNKAKDKAAKPKKDNTITVQMLKSGGERYSQNNKDLINKMKEAIAKGGGITEDMKNEAFGTDKVKRAQFDILLKKNDGFSKELSDALPVRKKKQNERVLNEAIKYGFNPKTFNPQVQTQASFDATYNDPGVTSNRNWAAKNYLTMRKKNLRGVSKDIIQKVKASDPYLTTDAEIRAAILKKDPRFKGTPELESLMRSYKKSRESAKNKGNT